MNFREAIQELKGRGSDRKEPSLEATREMLERLGRPDRDYTVVLIGGTNGKGSTATMVSELLQHQGFQVGLNTSPHLVTARERIRFNGQKVSEEEFLELYREIRVLEQEELTFFEFMTVAAYLYFSRREADYAIMEVGMGGRLDATNATEPELSIITNVAEEHTRYLGNSREEIAEEIAGIVPENGTVIQGETIVPVEKKARERGSETAVPERLGRLGSRYVYQGEVFHPPLAGSYQKENLENALAAVEQLESRPENLNDAVSDLQMPGRMDLMAERPVRIHDGAHNPRAVEKILEDLPEDFLCVFSALETKNIEQMIRTLENKASKFYLTQSGAPWAEDPERIQQFASIPAEVVQDPEKAEKRAVGEAGRDGSVVVTGSMYLVGDIRK